MKQICKILLSLITFSTLYAVEKPNVILIMTDDQGYGDLGCHGHPILKTPHLDQLHADSIRLTNFHVSPFCTPTRAALMTGRYPAHTGAYRTSAGKTMLHPDEVTIADVFSANGYVTGMVGKWHLGDNAPHRPQDHGYDEVLWHRCGGIGQASDYWGNDYFDDHYERSTPDNKQGTYEKFKGYCTDIWFQESMDFVERHQEKPFFLYLSLNAPHGPYFVAHNWSAPYGGKKGHNQNFLGMIANFDHNMGLLREHLQKLNLADNTILIFLTDNGTSSGGSFKGLDTVPVAGYNAGMRGKKSSYYEGGHRVPFFIYWKDGNLTGGKDLDHLSAHLDVLPTLTELCGLKKGETLPLDGASFKAALYDPQAEPHRDHYIVQFHQGAGGGESPSEWKYSCILHGGWRLMNGEELYHIKEDLAQQHNIADENPEIVEKLRAFYPPYWNSVKERMTPVSIDLGNKDQNPTVLCSQDWYMERGNPPWSSSQIKKRPKTTHPWKVDVKEAGTYKITLRQFPAEADEPILATSAKLKIADQELELPVPKDSKEVTFTLTLPAGKTELQSWLTMEEGKTGGACYAEVERLAN